MNANPLIKLFETNKKYYMYDANKNSIKNLSFEQFNFLKNGLKNNISDYTQFEETKQLCNEGFLSTNRVKEIIHPEDELLAFYLDNSLKMLTLQVTQQCNFRCEYCTYSGGYLNRTHTNKAMSIETAFKGIDFLIEHSKNNNKICIGFYGGEPLLEYDLIKKCVDYAEKQSEGKNLQFTMTTNGSLLTDEVIQFLWKHNFLLTISLDGPQEIQDSHRKLADNNTGTFDKVIKNIINLKTNYPEFTKKITINTVIDPKNNFASIDNFFLKNDIVKDIHMSSTVISDNYKKSNIKIVEEDSYVTKEYELFKIFYKIIKKKKLENCSRIMVNTYDEILNFSKQLKPQKQLADKMHPSGPCTPGVHRLFMNADGFLYPCERVSEASELMKIGHIDTGFDVEKAKKLLNLGKVNEKACKNCWAIKFCNICAAILDNTEDEFSVKRKEQCCKKSKASAEEKLKLYCFLKEFGHNFDENEPIPMIKG